MALLSRITHSSLWSFRNVHLESLFSSPRLRKDIPNRNISSVLVHRIRIRPDLGVKESTDSFSSYKSVDGVILVHVSRRGFGRTVEVFEEAKKPGGGSSGKEMMSESGVEKANPKPGTKDDSQQKGTISKKSMLKQAVKDYGATVVVFHVTMSLCSLGLCYFLVSSGLDLPMILEKLGIGASILESRLTQGASTFVIAYAVHKVFAPARIGITLTATPLIVRKLRTMGILKKPTS
jgi:hypothetical protein